MEGRKLLRPFDVRWFSNFSAIERVIELYPAIIEALQVLNGSDKCITTEMLDQQLKKAWNLMLLHSYADLLSPLNSLTKQFQSLNITFEEVKTAYTTCLSALRSFSQGNLGVRATHFIKAIERDENNNLCFKNITLTCQLSLDSLIQKLNEKTKEIADLLIKNIEKRFSQMDMFGLFSCLELNKIKSLNAKNTPNFGEQELKSLCSFYKNKGFLTKKKLIADSQTSNPYTIEENALLEEYRTLKNLLNNEWNSKPNEEVS